MLDNTRFRIRKPELAYFADQIQLSGSPKNK